LWDNPSRVQGTILPDNPGTYDLGSNELPFRDGYFSGNLYLSGDIVLDELLLADGSAADPSLAFVSSPNTGLYYTSNKLNFTTNGTKRMDVASTGLALTVPILLSGASSKISNAAGEVEI